MLATSTLQQQKMKNFLIRVDGALPVGVTAKDVILHVCGLIGKAGGRGAAPPRHSPDTSGHFLGTAGGTGYTIEFAGEAIRSLSMEGRMSICNMAIEAGARAGLIAPDDVTFDYLRGRPMVPAPESDEWAAAVAHWRSLASDADAAYDRPRISSVGRPAVEVRRAFFFWSRRTTGLSSSTPPPSHPPSPGALLPRTRRPSAAGCAPAPLAALEGLRGWRSGRRVAEWCRGPPIGDCPPSTRSPQISPDLPRSPQISPPGRIVRAWQRLGAARLLA